MCCWANCGCLRLIRLRCISILNRHLWSPRWPKMCVELQVRNVLAVLSSRSSSLMKSSMNLVALSLIVGYLLIELHCRSKKPEFLRNKSLTYPRRYHPCWRQVYLLIALSNDSNQVPNFISPCLTPPCNLLLKCPQLLDEPSRGLPGIKAFIKIYY
jgi:hypothetical protein